MPKGEPGPDEQAGTKKLLGVFTAPPPLCIGEQYKDRRVPDARSKGKQMGAGKYPTPLAAPGIFDKNPIFLFAEKEPYQEHIKYKDMDLKKAPLGFGSTDFPKRDEFSNTMRTEQLREVLRKEREQSKAALKQVEDYDDEEEEHMQSMSATRPPKSYLFDVVTRQVPTSFKHNRDDRQGKYFYMEQRKQQMEAARTQGTHGRANKTLTKPTWVNVTVDGRLLNVLVDSDGTVVGQQQVQEHRQGGGGD